MSTLSLGQIFLYETLGTALLLLLGCGVVATAILKNSKGDGGGWLLINFGWGIGVFVGVYAAFPTGAHLNPAVTVSQWMMGNIDAGQAFTYFAGEFLGAFLGAVLCWLAFREHFDAEEDPGKKLAVFSTGPRDTQPDLEHRYRGHRHLRAHLLDLDLWWHTEHARTAGRGPRRGGHRRVPWRPHRLCHQPGP